MASDEEDYMSNKFVTECEKVRPGLIRSRETRREIELNAKKTKLSVKSKAILEKEKREEGMLNSISSENKGFALLEKMGYKQGQSIGKSSTGIIEPIGFSIKLGRAGLGRETASKHLSERRLEVIHKQQKQSKKDTPTTNDFRKHLSQKSDKRNIESSLRKCQKACERLDLSKNIREPVVEWFWPNYDVHDSINTKDSDHNSEDESEVEYESHEKLERLTKYLRATYSFCHWCGIHYNDAKDLLDNCPGPNEDSH